MRVMHLFSSKIFAGLERHVEELAYDQKEKHDVQVIFRQANAENGRNAKLLDARGGAKWRNCAARRNKRHRITDTNAVTLGQTQTNGHPPAL